MLRADYPGRRVLFCACGLWDCTLCVLLIGPQRGLSPAADCRAEPSLSGTAALIFLHVLLTHFHSGALDFGKMQIILCAV